MSRLSNSILLALSFMTAIITFSGSVSAQTVKVLVIQEDADTSSLLRNGRIQSAVLNIWNQTLHAPAYQQIIQQYGITGMDVYDEDAVAMNFYTQKRQRRSSKEVRRLVQQIKNPKIDIVVLYSVYARAVNDPFTRIQKLQMSMNYKAIDVKSGRYMGGDNIDLDTTGEIITGCAAGLSGQKPDAHCVSEFVAGHAERLARNGANKMALQLAALLGQKYGQRETNLQPKSFKDNDRDFSAVQGRVTHRACKNIPTTFIVKYQGFSSRQINFIEGNMANWKCVLDLDTVNTMLSEINYEYKTRSSQQRVIRNIRLMSEMMGIITDTKINGRNKIIVKSLALRKN